MGISAGIAALVGLTAVGVPPALADGTFDPSTPAARVAGADRYATAAQTALSTWTTASTVVVVNGETNGIDAVSASYLAGVKDAPILLTKADSVPAQTAAAIASLKPTEVIVVGGEASVSASTYASLTAGRTGSRVAGVDRYETSVKVAETAVAAIKAGVKSSLSSASATTSTVFLARGDVYGSQVAADALAVSPVAFRAGTPVLLTKAGSLPSSTGAALSSLHPSTVIALGSEAAITTQVADAAGAAAGVSAVQRLRGSDRTQTAAAIADSEVAKVAGFGVTGVALTNGTSVDALAVGPAAGKAGHPLLLTASATSLGEGTLAYLQAHASTLTASTVYGGTSAISASAAVAAARAGGNTKPSGSSSVVALAQAFSATLSESQKTALSQKYTFANASNWSNFPNALLTGGGGPGVGTSGGSAPTGGSAPSGGTAPSGAPSGGTGSSTSPGGAGGTSSTGRVGLQTSTLSDAQWTALEDLLRAATGSAANEGFDEIMQHLAADDYLADNGGGEDYGRGNFFIAFLGTPSDSGTWELQFGGHHLAVANTYTDGELAGATPSFRGIEPLSTVTEDGTTVMPEQQERAAFAAVLASLSADQKSTAKLTKSFGDVLLGPGKDWAFPTTADGVKGATLSADQKKLLLAAIATYVDDVDDADAATILATYRSQLDDTYVSYAGSGNMTDVGDYIRIDGPQVWIEYSLQNGIVLKGAHPHAVWRDKKTDYAGTTS